MEKQISTFFAAPHFTDSHRGNRADILNRLLYAVAACDAVGLAITIVRSETFSALSLFVLLLLLLMVKVILQQKKLGFASFLFVGGLSLSNLMFSSLLPDWPVLGISLAFVTVIALLLLDFRISLVIYGMNVLGYLLLTLSSWIADINQLFHLGWIAMAVFLVLMVLNQFLKKDRERGTDLTQLCERFEQENVDLKSKLEETKTRLTSEIETRKVMEMKMRDELERDPSHRYNPQTGLFTEKAIFELIEQEISRTARYQRPLSLLCIRVDQMYQIVEKADLTPGKLLSMLSDAFNESLRREDILGHYEEDGFYALLPETGRYASYVVAERLRHLVEVMSLFNSDDGLKLTISIGLTAYQDQGKMSAEVFTGQSKDALAAAEQHGGNWTISWHDLTLTPS